MGNFSVTVDEIGWLDQKAMQKAQERLDILTKPQGSFGTLEEIAVKLAGITQTERPAIGDKVIIIMAADHGVAAKGISAFSQEVTGQMLQNFISGGAGVNVLARHVNARITCVDIGAAADLSDPKIKQRKIRYGTMDITRGPAMTYEEAIKALEAGILCAQEEIAAGASIIGVGEMGIGNTTPSSAILAVFSGFPIAAITGKGTGICEEILQRKIKAVEMVLAVNNPDPRDPIDVLAKVGGLEIAGLAGIIIGAAAKRIPVVLDGFISCAAALIAKKITSKVISFVFASHNSAEPGHEIMLRMLGLEAVLKLKMRLGEGTGAALGISLVEAASKIINEMATFTEAGVSNKVRLASDGVLTPSEA